MQTPIACHITLGFNFTTTSTRLQMPPHIPEMDSSRAGLNLHFARRGLFKANVAAACPAIESAGNPQRLDGAATRLGICSRLYILHRDRSRTGVGMHFATDIAQLEASRSRAGSDHSTNIADLLAARAGGRMYATIAWSDNFVADRDIIAQTLI